MVKPIVSSEVFSWFQVDFIDLQSCPDTIDDKSYKFILHGQDHLTKFCFLRAIEDKSAQTTIEHIKSFFDIIGPPTILHTDNGREFCNNIISEYLVKYGVKMINRKPRHSQSQGSVERGNRDIEDMIAAWYDENNLDIEVNLLEIYNFRRNSCYHRKFPIMWLELGNLQNFTISMVVRMFSCVFARQNV